MASIKTFLVVCLMAFVAILAMAGPAEASASFPFLSCVISSMSSSDGLRAAQRRVSPVCIVGANFRTRARFELSHAFCTRCGHAKLPAGDLCMAARSCRCDAAAVLAIVCVRKCSQLRFHARQSLDGAFRLRGPFGACAACGGGIASVSTAGSTRSRRSSFNLRSHGSADAQVQML